MADEQSQRPYRASEPPLRSHAGTSNNDPLAELARLIGQTDPFGEFGRDTARRSAAPVERADWNTPAPSSPYAPRDEADWRESSSQRPDGNGYYNARGAVGEQSAPADYDDQNYGRQPYGGAQELPRDDLYQADHEARGYPSGQANNQYDTYEQDAAQHPEDEYYDQAPSSRRRLGVMAIAGVFALALIGTAGAFGYRALFGSSGSTQPPPVIKADAGPSKVVPATSSKDAQSSKLITERVNERGQSEKLVSREEQPIDKPTTVVLSQVAPQSAVGSGVVGSEPKKVRTIAIRPDQPADAQAAASLATPAAARAPQAPTAPAKPAAAPVRPAENISAGADFRIDAGTRSAFCAISPSGDAFCQYTIVTEPGCFPCARSSATVSAPDSDRRRRTASRVSGSRHQQYRQWELCAGFLTAQRGRGPICIPRPSSQVPDPAW